MHSTSPSFGFLLFIFSNSFLNFISFSKIKSGFLYYINTQIPISQASHFCTSNLNSPYSTLYSSFSCLECQIAYSTSLLLFLSQSIAFPDQPTKYMFLVDMADSLSSTGSTRVCLFSKILAKSSHIYSITAFDQRRILTRCFFKSVVDFEFPFAFLESARFFYFSEKDFVCFEIVLFHHFPAVLVNID